LKNTFVVYRKEEKRKRKRKEKKGIGEEIF
jgi:hypothetical protein